MYSEYSDDILCIIYCVCIQKQMLTPFTFIKINKTQFRSTMTAYIYRRQLIFYQIQAPAFT